MSITKLDAPQVLQIAFNEALGALKTQPIAGSLVTAAYDTVTVTYPTDTTEAYAFRTGGQSGTIINTVTVTYTDNTKASISSVVRT